MLVVDLSNKCNTKLVNNHKYALSSTRCVLCITVDDVPANKHVLESIHTGSIYITGYVNVKISKGYSPTFVYQSNASASTALDNSEINQRKLNNDAIGVIGMGGDAGRGCD